VTDVAGGAGGGLGGAWMLWPESAGPSHPGQVHRAPGGYHITIHRRGRHDRPPGKVEVVVDGLRDDHGAARPWNERHDRTSERANPEGTYDPTEGPRTHRVTSAVLP